MPWDLPNPHILPIEVDAAAIDEYDHVSNIEYLRWIEAVSWQHSIELGLDLVRYQALDRGLVVHRHELDYLAPAFEGEQLELATWITDCDGRLTLMRHFQLRRPADDRTLLRAATRFVCVELSSGRARRLPAEYVEIYGSALVTMRDQR